MKLFQEQIGNEKGLTKLCVFLDSFLLTDLVTFSL